MDTLTREQRYARLLDMVRSNFSPVTQKCVDEALEYADRIIALHEGKLVFDGEPKELLKTDLPMRIFGASVQTVQAEGKTFYHMDVM